jgi:hypothetical protein
LLLRAADPFFGQQEKQDTWILVQADSRVYSFDHEFRPGTSEKKATEDIKRLDLPPDARLVQSKVGDGCKLFLYRSATLGRQASDLGPLISVFYTSPPDETVYNARDIWSARVSSDTQLGSC